MQDPYVMSQTRSPACPGVSKIRTRGCTAADEAAAAAFAAAAATASAAATAAAAVATARRMPSLAVNAPCRTPYQGSHLPQGSKSEAGGRCGSGVHARFAAGWPARACLLGVAFTWIEMNASSVPLHLIWLHSVTPSHMPTAAPPCPHSPCPHWFQTPWSAGLHHA